MAAPHSPAAGAHRARKPVSSKDEPFQDAVRAHADAGLRQVRPRFRCCQNTRRPALELCTLWPPQDAEISQTLTLALSGLPKGDDSWSTVPGGVSLPAFLRRLGLAEVAPPSASPLTSLLASVRALCARVRGPPPHCCSRGVPHGVVQAAYQLCGRFDCVDALTAMVAQEVEKSSEHRGRGMGKPLYVPRSRSARVDFTDSGCLCVCVCAYVCVLCARMLPPPPGTCPLSSPGRVGPRVSCKPCAGAHTLMSHCWRGVHPTPRPPSAPCSER